MAHAYIFPNGSSSFINFMGFSGVIFGVGGMISKEKGFKSSRKKYNQLFFVSVKILTISHINLKE